MMGKYDDLNKKKRDEDAAVVDDEFDGHRVNMNMNCIIINQKVVYITRPNLFRSKTSEKRVLHLIQT